jgi:hypothetical protein
MKVFVGLVTAGGSRHEPACPLNPGNGGIIAGDKKERTPGKSLGNVLNS